MIIWKKMLVNKTLGQNSTVGTVITKKKFLSCKIWQRHQVDSLEIHLHSERFLGFFSTRAPSFFRVPVFMDAFLQKERNFLRHSASTIHLNSALSSHEWFFVFRICFFVWFFRPGFNLYRLSPSGSGGFLFLLFRVGPAASLKFWFYSALWVPSAVSPSPRH